MSLSQFQTSTASHARLSSLDSEVQRSERTLCSPDAQRAVLGSVLLDNRLMDVVDLKVDDFSGSTDQTIYAAIMERTEKGEAFDPDVIASDLAEGNTLER